MSKSDNDLMNSATDHQMYPGQLIPPGRTESQPSISGLRTTEESTYNRTRTGQHPQTLLSEVRIAKVLAKIPKTEDGN